MAKFKPRTQYDTRQGSAQTEQAAGSAEQPHEDALLQWAMRTFLEVLVKRSADEINDAEAVAAFRLVAEQVNKLSNDDREDIVKDMDFFTGRLKSNIVPVLEFWYRAIRK